ncbi:Uncharacterized protein HZ326_25666 [Fusarium oxysporum f. sp. albedinis]|nr:Uncharacterized protein HZ326_25666 [Fusarium oxysporum f. sp. albedinis]
MGSTQPALLAILHTPAKDQSLNCCLAIPWAGTLLSLNKGSWQLVTIGPARRNGTDSEIIIAHRIRDLGYFQPL